MLTGGLDVVGVFAFGPSDMLTKTQGKLRQLLFSFQKTVHHKPASYFGDLSHSRILLQICSATKKYPLWSYLTSMASTWLLCMVHRKSSLLPNPSSPCPVLSRKEMQVSILSQIYRQSNVLVNYRKVEFYQCLSFLYDFLWRTLTL